MSIKAGSVSFRMFKRNGMSDGEVIRRLSEYALPALNTVGHGQVSGFVTARHAADRAINEDNALLGGHVVVGLTAAEKRVPSSLLKAECRMEEIAAQQAMGHERLKAADRAVIRKAVEERLMAGAQHTLRTIDIAFVDHELVIATCTNDSQQDHMMLHWVQATGKTMLPVDIGTIYPGVKDWGPRSFTAELADYEADNMPGAEFLTWLWFLAEARGGMVKIGGLGDVAVMIEGPLVMGMEGQGAHEAVLRKGEPMLGGETKAALLAGKKLRRAKVTLARGDQSWVFTLDHGMTVRGLRVPEGEKLDIASRFQERMSNVKVFEIMVGELVRRFAGERNDAEVVEEIKAWVAQRRVRG